MPTVNAESLTRRISAIFQACGVPAAEAELVAEHLVDTEACGVVSHGVLRVPQYVEGIVEGRVRPGAVLRSVSETVATAVLDGQFGFGQVMASRAMELAVEKASQTGVGVVTLVNCGHTGRLGYYTERVARKGMASLMMVNSGGAGQWVAPFGGTAGRISTNPLSLAVPMASGEPLVLDMATSAAPEGKIRALLTAGSPIPIGWVIDHAGRPTTNPADLYGPPRGALLPFGGHKGFGLSMLVDALAGGLSGAGCCRDPQAPMQGRTDGVLLLALDIRAFCPVALFQEMVSQLVQNVKSSPPGPGVAEILVPGEAEARQRTVRERQGIPVEEATWGILEQTARQRGVAWDE
jgi:uncharacterized oxidoreductase